jgi:hypothetical protein
MPMEDLILAYVDVLEAHPSLARLFLWEALAYTPGGGAEHAPEAGEQAPEVADLARRQREGELSADFDPAYLLLIFMAVTIAPLALSHQVRQFTGLEPDSPEFIARFREQLRLLVRSLGGDRPPPRPRSGGG